VIVIDGAFGEGGGQILRTSLTLSILSGQAVKIKNIRARRPKPGLAAQHLTAARAAAAICGATVSGDKFGSQELVFEPGGQVQGGNYVFDVVRERGAGSAGAVSLVLQTVLLPLAFAADPSRLTLRGGTHVSWSPSFLYLEEVFMPILSRLGLEAELELQQPGFYPAGGGEFLAHVIGGLSRLTTLSLCERGALQNLWGTALVANLPSHIPQRMANRARNLLAESGLKADVQALRVRASGPGAGIFLFAAYESGARAGVTAYGRKGLPAERVAEAACRDFIDYHETGAPVGEHLADQLIVPLSYADGSSEFVVGKVTEHLRTNIWVVEQFAQADIDLAPTQSQNGGKAGTIVTVLPRHETGDASS
jgi:RNA 3'-terminal phosphate cyclase (ATP)